MYCAISGEVPQEPVVSKVSGHLFERRLIEKALEASKGVCPATGAELKTSDLVAVKADLAVRPRPVTATSLPGLMALFQNEWDDVMLECHELKQQLHATRKELSHALYQHDAACRVIARLSKEREEARTAATQLREQVAAQAARLEAMAHAAPAAVVQATTTTTDGGVAGPPPPPPAVSMEVDGGAGSSAREAASNPEAPAADSDEKAAAAAASEEAGLGAAVEARLTEFWKTTSKGRKKRAASPGLAPRDAIRSWARDEPAFFPEKQGDAPKPEEEARDGAAQLTSLASLGVVVANPEKKTSAAVVVGGMTGALTVVDCAARPARLTSSARDAHAGGVLSLSSLSATAVLACDPHDAAVWTWGTDEAQAPPVRTALGEEDADPRLLASVAAHPTREYGVVGSSDASWSFFDLARPERSVVRAAAAKGDIATGPLKIHPDGLILAAPATDADGRHRVRVWDVKARTNVHSFDGHAGAVRAVAFSENGYYMASAATDDAHGVRVWDLRKLTQLKALDVEGGATAVAFDFSGKYVAYADVANTVKVDVVKEWDTLCAVSATGAVTDLLFGPDATFLAASTATGALDLFRGGGEPPAASSAAEEAAAS